MTPSLATGLNRLGHSSPLEVFPGAVSLSEYHNTGEPPETPAHPEGDFSGKQPEDPDKGYGNEIKDMMSEIDFHEKNAFHWVAVKCLAGSLRIEYTPHRLENERI